MYSHKDIWSAIDHLARTHGYSASGLARKAGLDPTSFNKSKRKSADGKPRWPSTESISKILAVTGMTASEFLGFAEKKESQIGFDKALTGGDYDKKIKAGDSVILRTKGGQLAVGVLANDETEKLGLKITGLSRPRKFEKSHIDWIAKISALKKP